MQNNIANNRKAHGECRSRLS